MPYAFMGFLAFIFIGMTLANRLLEGNLIHANDVAILNQVTIFRDMEVFGLFTIPVPNFEWLTGLFHLVKMDYSYFGGQAGLIQYFFYSFTFVVAAISFTLIIGLLVNAFLFKR